MKSLIPLSPLHPLNRQIRRYSFSIANVQDAAALSRCMTGWNHTYEQVERGPFRGEITDLWLWPLQIVRERVGQPCIYRGSAWKGSVTFALPLDTQGKTVCQSRDMFANQIITFPGSHLHRAYMNGPTDCFVVAIDHDSLCSYAREKRSFVIPLEILQSSLSIGGGENVLEFHSCVSGILNELTKCPELLDDEQYRNRVVENILSVLVRLLERGAVVTAKHGPRPTTHAYVVEKADQYMLARLAESLNIADICCAVRVSARTLRYSFEDVVGVSPAQYLLVRRLNRVRQELLNSGDRVQIRCIAERFGFCHMGRFAEFYQAAFGERPKDTCRRAGGKEFRSKEKYGSRSARNRLAAC